MKNIFIVLFMFFAFGLGAQTLYTFTVPTAGTLDTLKNTGTLAMTLTVRSAYDTGAFQVNVAKVSGTIAGTCVLQYSVNGTTYHTSTTVGDTLTLSNVTTNSKVWPITDPPYPYYKILCTGSGTMAAIGSAKAHFKKK